MPSRLRIFGILFLALAVLIFVFADGLRRWYSGGFFLIIGVWMLLQARRSGSADKSE
jgi:putative Ca2+/H+ antiporter (TMEM165/GDT1 family)